MSALVLLALLVAATQAGVRRFAVLVGNNEGFTNTERLYFAERDAEKIHRILTNLGQVDPGDAQLLLGRNRNEILGAMVGLRGEIALANEHGDESVVVFYYSGHADEEKLQLGRTWLRYEEIDSLLERTGADVRIALIDACKSGAMTRAKGGKRAPAFAVDLTERLSATGQVVITSSSGDENSQESDEIGGSYFTHYLASALSGAADADRNDVVTLAEAYQYVYRETVFRTAGSRAGAQHPTYEWDLAGAGDLLLTDLREARGAIVFPGQLGGRYAVFDQNRRQFVAEVDLSEGQDFKLSLIPGTYLIQQRYPTHLEVAEIHVRDGTTQSLAGDAFAAVEYERDVAKGAIERQIKAANRPDTAVHLLVGTLGSGDDEIETEYLPRVAVAGAMGRWHWRDRQFLAVDVMSGASHVALTPAELEYAIPAVVNATTFGVTAGYATRPTWGQAGIGVRLAGVHFLRSFPELGLDSQALFTVSPGYNAFAGLRFKRMELDLQLRGHLVPFAPDDRDRIFGFSEAILSLGYRF